jgi:hypothetical protein
MAERDFFGRDLHDKVINAAVQVLNKVDYDIYTNPGSTKNAAINDNFPDIILTEKDKTTVKFIIEVETRETVNDREAEFQWKKYSTEIDATFYLLVPNESKSLAESICRRLGINARFATFVSNQQGVTVNFS